MTDRDRTEADRDAREAKLFYLTMIASMIAGAVFGAAVVTLW